MSDRIKLNRFKTDHSNKNTCMYPQSERNKAVNPHKMKQIKRISRFIKMLKSFDQKQSVQKYKKNPQNNDQSLKKIQKPELYLNFSPYKKSFPSINTYQTNLKRMKSNQNIPTISKYSGRKISLPSINIDIYFQTKKHSLDQVQSSNRIKTQHTSSFSRKLPKLFFNKLEGTSNGNLLQFLKKKPTEKYFTKRQNVRLAQRLLLMQPSKELRKCEHEKFYEEQKTYRSKISQSRMMNKRPHKYSKSEWIS